MIKSVCFSNIMTNFTLRKFTNGDSRSLQPGERGCSTCLFPVFFKSRVELKEVGYENTR